MHLQLQPDLLVRCLLFLCHLLEDNCQTKRPNIISTYIPLWSEKGIQTFLRHLSQPLSVGQRVIVDTHECIVESFEPSHNKDDILKARSSDQVRIELRSADEYKNNRFIDLS